MNITVGEAYAADDGSVRIVVGFGSTKDWIVWGRAQDRLPLGGFDKTRCTSRRSFERWFKKTARKP